MSSSEAERRILVTGASGQLGTAFRNVYPGATFVDRAELELGRPELIRPFIGDRSPRLIVNCAAYTGVDAAEDDLETVHLLNAVAVEHLARASAEIGARFVTFSTDYVFDGSADRPLLESDPTNPINAYGASKLSGERAALEVNPASLVVRTSWLLSGTHDNFASAILRRALGGAVKVVDDQVGAPTVADDLARAVAEAVARDMTGVLHLTNAGATSWYGLARALVADAGLDADVVAPCPTSEFPTRARRPSYSVLGTERQDAPRLRSWQVAVEPVAKAQLSRVTSSA